jgi:hypothetical protein
MPDLKQIQRVATRLGEAAKTERSVALRGCPSAEPRAQLSGGDKK